MDLSALAKMMGTDEKELNMLLVSVVNSLKADKAVNHFVNASESQRIEMSEAYVIHAVKKFQSFVSSYLTNQECKQSFREFVYASLKS